MTGSDSERWHRLQQIFKAAVAVEPSERETFLRAQCGDDSALFDELTALLGATGEPDEAYERIVRDAAVDLTRSDDAARIDRQVGNYKLIELVGGGGMGNVYLAERVDDQFDHRVAIKLLHTRRHEKSMIQRFLSERQMLANLEHPNIARLLDGGETDDGIPFLVMEYVVGLPVDSYCDENRLSVAARLRLFQKIADAVNYAHRNLVVHRDIKPSNILVNESGEPKLLDFGIAKYIGDEAMRQAAAVTLDGQSAMTPEYASPEQVRGQPVSTATDIYSMGVLLYKMLCGRMPYGPRSGVGLDLAQAILEEQPSRPSTALTEDDARLERDSAESISAQRSTSAVRLKSRLKGDLDNIVLMTLRKEPERRYTSALALSQDIDRYLEHRPVSARADSALYRAGKFVRRHRIAVVVATLVVAFLAAGVFQINQQRNRASIAAAQSEEFAGFLSNLFASAATDRAQGEVVTASDLLAAGVGDIDDLAGQPEVQARLLDVMGLSYTWIGEFERGEELLERALRIRQAALPYDPIALAATLRDLAQSRKEQGDLAGAEKDLNRVLDLLHEAHGDRHPDIAFAMGRLGDVVRLQFREEEAVAILSQAVAMNESLGQTNDVRALDVMGNLAIALDSSGRLEESETLAVEVAATSRRVLGNSHPNTIIRIANLGLIQVRRGKFGESYETINEAYGLMHEVWASNPNQMSWILSIQGGALKYVGRFAQAGEVYDELFQLTLDAYGPEADRHLHTLRHLGAWNIDQARYAEGARYFEEIIATVSDTPSLPREHMGRAVYRLAQARTAMGDPGGAEALINATLAQPEQIRTATILSLKRELATSLSIQGHYQEASTLFGEVVSGREAYSGPESIGMTKFLREASGHFRRNDEPQRAFAFSVRAHEIGLSITPRGTWLSALSSAEHGRVLLALGEQEEALAVMEQAHSDLLRTFGPGDPRVKALSETIADASH